MHVPLRTSCSMMPKFPPTQVLENCEALLPCRHYPKTEASADVPIEGAPCTQRRGMTRVFWRNRGRRSERVRSVTPTAFLDPLTEGFEDNVRC
jgi:hypothetical protein